MKSLLSSPLFLACLTVVAGIAVYMGAIYGLVWHNQLPVAEFTGRGDKLYDLMTTGAVLGIGGILTAHGVKTGSLAANAAASAEANASAPYDPPTPGA